MEKIGRNELCPCGSGKKYKKCCLNKNPRDHYVYIGNSEEFEGFSCENGEVFIQLPTGKKEKPDEVFSQTQYTRKKGSEKIVNLIPGFAIDPSYLASNFNIIYAIDTNTKQIENNKISVCSIIECTFRNDAAQKNQVLVFRKNGNILFKNCPDGLEEKFSWVKFIKLLISSQNYSGNLKFAIITDHDLGNHNKYNNRELPLVRDFYLPDNFTLMYASSDTGKEFLLNKLIIECEKDAKEILKKFEKNKIVNLNNTKVSIDSIQEPNFNNL